MSDIKLYAIQPEVRELQALELSLEKSIQTIIEKNMNLFFGVTFLKSGYQTANGRIDSIGIDENNCPVVFEYKQSINENVINQGLFYLDWLLDHKADFKLLIMETLGSQAAVKIDWSRPCIICIADDFTKFDEHAVNQMKRNIKLVRYRYYNTFLLLEHLNAPNVKPFAYSPKNINNTSVSERSEITFDGQYRNASEQLKTLYRKIRNYVLSLGDEVTENQLKQYVAFKKTSNIVCAHLWNKTVVLHLRLDPRTVEMKKGFTMDVTNKGHWGTGDLRIIVRTMDDFESAKRLILRAYFEN